MSVSRRRRRGLTLLEVLLTIVITAVVVSVAAAGLAAQDSSGALRSALADWRRIDVEARSTCAAQARGMTLRVMEGSAVLVAAEGKVIRQWQWDRRVGIALESSSGSTMRKLAIDSRGRSRDYIVFTRIDRRARSLSVSGLTGAVATAESRKHREGGS